MYRASIEAAKAFRGIPIDMVFLDASHDLDNVKRHSRVATVAAPGGLLCGHDRQWDGVKQAIDELLPGHQVGAGAIWYAA